MSSPFALVRGRVIRVTRLNDDGTLHSSGDYVTTNAVARIEVRERTYSHADSIETDDKDRVVLVPHEYEEIVGYTVGATFMQADPDILNIVSGNPLVEDDNLDVVGFGADAHVKPPTFSLEVWSRLASPCKNGNRWGYTLFPRLTGGRLTGLDFDNALATFQIAGASCMRAPIWEPCDFDGFGVDPFGDGPFGDDSTDTCGGFRFGLGPFGQTPFDAVDAPTVQVTSYNRFWITQTVPGHPGPHRSIVA